MAKLRVFSSSISSQFAGKQC